MKKTSTWIAFLTIFTLFLLTKQARNVTTPKKSHSQFLKELKQTYKKECSTVDHIKNLTKIELKTEHEDLQNFMKFSRKSPSEIPLKKLNAKDVLSTFGWITMIIPFFITITTFFGLIMAVMFFFFPNIFSFFFKMMVPDYSIEVIPSPSKTDIKKLEYFKEIRKRFNQSQNLFKLFMFRFILSVILIALLIFGLALVINFDMDSDCGINKTAIDVLEGGEGVDFNEFRNFKNNGSLLMNFNEDLKSFENEGIDYKNILNQLLIEKAVSVGESFYKFYLETKPMKIVSCSNPEKKFSPLVVDNTEYMIKDEIKNEVIESIDFATNLHEGALILKNLDTKKHKKLENFVKSSENLMVEVDILYRFYEETYKAVREFFGEFYHLLFIMAIVSLIWFLQAFWMLLPKDTMKSDSIKISLKFQILSLILGACIMGFSGSFLFLKSQLMVGECLGVYKMLDQPKEVQKYLGKDDKEWAKICISKEGKGDILEFLNKGDRENFQFGLSILKGFSSNFSEWKDIMQENEPNSVKVYGMLLDSLKNFELDGTRNKPEHGYQKVIDEINESLEKKEIQINEENCSPGYKTGDFSSIDEKGKKCYVLNGNEEEFGKNIDKMLVGISGDRKGRTRRKMKNLLNCLTEYKTMMQNYIEMFQVVRLRLVFLFSHLKKVDQTYKTIRKRFKNSIKDWEKLQYHDIKKTFNCKGLRDVTERALASACYSRFYTYGAVITSFCFIGSSVILALLSFISFMEMMADKTVLRKFEELNKTKISNLTSGAIAADNMDHKMELI